ncbi:hypothetical protein COEREDRAFT_7796 [Coemansia reversa NRRL 1564]|uniref:C3H1-type domain-containing protein n=1 Tax=Coemansia reversa (strain ATCC 12441 / NRRL 1564) TaxID=763665 RepID=A0A2G5BDD7_COERN|nr:hypothetical protein COEREDRAFT_7796 [Coemansia reversa NRRL 1564]|eukprot:PIA17029.1 hypothetical protein COEREDRAFT_7796 [Coemansia reversa NRRL 1564]
MDHDSQHTPSQEAALVDDFISHHVHTTAAPASPVSHVSVPDPSPESDLVSQDMIHPLIRNRPLESAEDIAAWIAERRSRYPTEANIRRKAAEEKTAAASKRPRLDTLPDTDPLGALAAYGPPSDTASDAESSDSGSDNSPPTVASVKCAVHTPFRPSGLGPGDDRRKLRVCRFYARGSCHKGAACPFSHPESMKPANESSVEPSDAQPATLLARLMAKDIDRENRRVLQCIEYILDQNFLNIPSQPRIFS